MWAFRSNDESTIERRGHGTEENFQERIWNDIYGLFFALTPF